MLERLKQIPKKLIEIWKKYTKRQKVIVASTIGTVIVTLVILIILLNQIQYEKLMTFENTATAKAAITVLEENQIAYKLENDNVTVSVDVKRKQDAVLALSDSDIVNEEQFTLANLLENDLSTTSSDKMLKNHLYAQSYLNSKITTFDGVEKASVFYSLSDNNSSILSNKKETSCSVLLTINDDFDKRVTPSSIATYVAYSIGNETTDKIKVVDQHGNLLFGGEEEDKDIEDMNANFAYKKMVEKWYNDKLFELAIKNGFQDAAIVSSLSVNCDKTSVLFTEYLAGEGMEQGLYDSYKKITSESTGDAGDIPGTDSNDETDYYIQTGNTGNSSYDEIVIQYKPSERVTETMKEWGAISNEDSSLALTLTRMIPIREEDLESEGLLEDISFEKYVSEHSDKEPMEVSDELYTLFSDASGIPVQNIKITAYRENNFFAKETTESNASLYLEILLAILIVGLLLFVVFRAMKPEEVIETEPELSVERLLATTKENQSLEDIEFGEKSETRKMIEKYIDENAGAVAALLRNWLSDDGWD